jgi:hypothetical protein
MIGEQLLACSFCGTATVHSALATFGARCKPCFDAYCLQKTAPPANPQGRWPEWQSRKAKAALMQPEDAAPAALAAPLPIVRRAEAETATHDNPPAWATEGAGE